MYSNNLIKKAISCILIIYVSFFWVLPTNAATSVTISAIVGNINSAPVILNISPNWNPEALPTNTLQNFSITVKDAEKDNITYTYTAQDWNTTPISWTILTSSYDVNNQVIINFSYLSPSVAVWTTKITLTINDWVNVIYQDINLYIY